MTTDTEVIIGGKVLTMSGHESEEYMQKVASYINNKLNEYNKLENTSKSLKEAQDEINENSKSIIRMETELKEYRKEDNKAANH